MDNRQAIKHFCLSAICGIGLLGGGCFGPGPEHPLNIAGSIVQPVLGTKRYETAPVFQELPEGSKPTAVYGNVLWWYKDGDGFTQPPINFMGYFLVYTNEFRFKGHSGAFAVMPFEEITGIYSVWITSQVHIQTPRENYGFVFMKRSRKGVEEQLKKDRGDIRYVLPINKLPADVQRR
ncbi:MAG: hypothetical protein AABX11_00625 [Nanoarchaeota archaeon]